MLGVTTKLKNLINSAPLYLRFSNGLNYDNWGKQIRNTGKKKKKKGQGMVWEGKRKAKVP